MGAMILGLLVTSTASDVRPWKALAKDTTRVRPLWKEGHLLLELVDDGVGVEAQGGYLVADHLHVVRMGVADGDDGMAAVEVEVLRTVLVPHVAAFPFDDVDVEQRIYIE